MMQLPGKLFAMAVVAVMVLATSQAVQAVGLEKLLMPGRVIEGHADIEGQCGSCHDDNSDQAAAALCVGCHEGVGDDRRDFKGFHGLFDAARTSECIACHTDHEGRDADIVALDSGLFDHAFTDFPLLDAHATATCGDCHQEQQKHRDAGSTCGSCHANVDIHDGSLGQQCQTCHTEQSWSDSRFDHSLTDYPLTGGHLDAECVDCHRGNEYAGVAQTCNSCHAIDDVHSGSNGVDCQSCHSTETWQSIGFNHLLETGFALADGHGGLVCQDCHSQDDFGDDFSAGCTSCHQGEDDHQGRNGKQCANCHKPTQWPDTIFQHADTGFTLHDSHATLNCISCHKAEVEQSIPTDCQSCHVQDNPHGQQMETTCDSCHVQTSWLDAIVFDHDLSSFPLTGLHAAVSCGGCHESRQFADAPATCNGCHADDDVHQGSLGIECVDCHTSNAWTTTVFDHDLNTDFKLEGGHKGLACNDCHQESSRPGAADVPQNCGGCHATDDPHDRQFGVQCGDCHNTTDFGQVEQL